MIAKNSLCLWYDSDAEGAARFYAVTLPDSRVDAVHRAPDDYPGGKAGDVLTTAMAAGGGPAKCAFAAMMAMGKIDVSAIEAAVRGG